MKTEAMKTRMQPRKHRRSLNIVMAPLSLVQVTFSGAQVPTVDGAFSPRRTSRHKGLVSATHQLLLTLNPTRLKPFFDPRVQRILINCVFHFTLSSSISLSGQPLPVAWNEHSAFQTILLRS